MGESPRVKSDRTLFSILEILRERGPVRVTDIATELDVAKSTAHNHLAMLQEQNFATQTDEGYQLGLQFLGYGLESQHRQEIFELGKRKVEELAERTGEQSWCVVEEHGKGVFLTGAAGEHSITPPEKTGTRRYLHCISAGKAILAHLDPEYVDWIVEEHGLEAKTQHTVTDREELEEDLAEIRERGVAYNLQEGILGVHAIGAPVLDTDGSVFGSFSIAGPANRLTKDRLDSEFADLLRGASNEVAVNIRT
jgi:DNA-binding IclR family transcriptional regulator